MQLGIVSDTHGHLEFARPAVRLLKSQGVDLVIHCGDIGSVEIVRLFSDWPTHFVFGNVDYPEPPLRRAIEAEGQTCQERFGTLEVAGRKIAFLHGDDARLLDDTIREESFDAVCHGHTHVPRSERFGATLIINPGALFRAPQHTLAILQLPEMQLKHHLVDGQD